VALRFLILTLPDVALVCDKAAMKLWVILVLAVSGLGCDAVMPDYQRTRYFAAVQVDAPMASIIGDPGPSISAIEMNRFEPILDGFRKNHELLLSQDDVRQQLDRIETVYIATGRYLELVGIYQRDVEKRGAKSHAAARLAWSYIRLGQERQAKELIALLKKEESEEAMAYFLEGTTFLQWDPSAEDSKKGVFRAWSRALELEPNFKGFESISAAQMRSQIDQIRPLMVEEKSLSAMELAQERIAKISDGAQAATTPDADVPEAPDVDEAPSNEAPGDEATVSDEALPASPSADPAREYRIAVARAELLLNEARFQDAEDAFLVAKTIDPNGFAAEFGHLRAGWGIETARPRIRPRLRALAERDDLTGRQAYDLGLFLLRHANERELATNLLNRVKELDPELANRVQIDRILQ